MFLGEWFFDLFAELKWFRQLQVVLKNNWKALLFAGIGGYFFFFVLFPDIHSWLRANYRDVFSQTLGFVVSFTFSPLGQAFAVVVSFITLILLLRYVFWQLKGNRVISKNAHRDLKSWSKSRNVPWVLTTDKDTSGKVLKINNEYGSMFPGILKYGSTWINYIFSFEVKLIPNEKKHVFFSFIVRARSITEGVIFTVYEDGRVEQVYLAKATYIIDRESSASLPIDIQPDKWMKVTVKVDDDEVTLTMLGTSKSFKILSETYWADAEKLSPALVKLEDLKSDDKRFSKLSTSDRKESAPKLVSLEYERGTVGFGGHYQPNFERDFSNSSSQYRNTKVTLLEPIPR